MKRRSFSTTDFLFSSLPSTPRDPDMPLPADSAASAAGTPMHRSNMNSVDLLRRPIAPAPTSPVPEEEQQNTVERTANDAVTSRNSPAPAVNNDTTHAPAANLTPRNLNAQSATSAAPASDASHSLKPSNSSLGSSLDLPKQGARKTFLGPLPASVLARLEPSAANVSASDATTSEEAKVLVLGQTRQPSDAPSSSSAQSRYWIPSSVESQSADDKRAERPKLESSGSPLIKSAGAADARSPLGPPRSLSLDGFPHPSARQPSISVDSKSPFELHTAPIGLQKKNSIVGLTRKAPTLAPLSHRRKPSTLSTVSRAQTVRSLGATLGAFDADRMSLLFDVFWNSPLGVQVCLWQVLTLLMVLHVAADFREVHTPGIQL